VAPDAFAKVMGITNLPPKDFSIVSATYKASGAVKFDMYKPGILDVFLSVIAKALTVQVKVKSKTGGGGAPKEINTVTLATSIHPKDNLGKRWWLRGCVNRKLAEVIVHLIKDMAAVSEVGSVQDRV
jgi:E3 ubiquitin-protein ligase MYCBP2